jgi:spoIIIJ-associated protein
MPEELLFETGTSEEARERAAATWGIAPEDVEVQVTEEEKRFLGLFGKRLKVRAVPRFPLPVLRARDRSRDLLALMELDVEGALSEEGIDLSGEDAGIVIGRYGETLKALEYLTNLTLRDEFPEAGRVRFDSGGYRARRETSLERLAEASARDAARRGRPIYLEPMSSWERRIVHLALKDDPDVETRSVGEEPFRKVVLWPKHARNEAPRRRVRG